MTVDIRRLVADLYAAMGWDEEGRPTPGILRALDLEEFAAEEM
jgi:aldehyde:ferredoxin oxidoreductase